MPQWLTVDIARSVLDLNLGGFRALIPALSESHGTLNPLVLFRLPMDIICVYVYQRRTKTAWYVFAGYMLVSHFATWSFRLAGIYYKAPVTPRGVTISFIAFALFFCYIITLRKKYEAFLSSSLGAMRRTVE